MLFCMILVKVGLYLIYVATSAIKSLQVHFVSVCYSAKHHLRSDFSFIFRVARLFSVCNSVNKMIKVLCHHFVALEGSDSIQWEIKMINALIESAIPNASAKGRSILLK